MKKFLLRHARKELICEINFLKIDVQSTELITSRDATIVQLLRKT